MTATSASVNIDPGTAAAQAAVAYDAIATELAACGYTRIIAYNNHASGATRGELWRFPPLDDYHSRADFLAGSAPNSGVFEWYRWMDGNVQQALSTVQAHNFSSGGGWSGGTWPSSGSPQVADIGTVNARAQFVFNGSSSYTMRFVVSAYGFVIAISTGGVVDILAVERPMDPIRARRNMQVTGVPTEAYPLTFVAPTGDIAAHLRIRIEGVDFDVTFPEDDLNAFRIAQELTRQLGGFGEADLVDRIGGEDGIVIRIPPERAPVGAYSTERPRIAITYQDPSMVTTGLIFTLGPAGTGQWEVDAANPGAIQRDDFVFPTSNVRIGGTVRNHTRNQAYEITGFETTNTQDDTARLDGNTSTWDPADDIEVYPGPEEHMHGLGRHGGLYAGVLSGAETTTITDGADRILVLSDRFGEAQNQYEVGQNVFIMNNSACVNLALSSVSGAFLHHEIVEVTSGTGPGSRGIIRGIDGTTIAVDTIEGASGHSTPYNIIPWTSTATITGQTSGATAVITVTANTNVGWYAFATVLAVGQVDAAGGDYRTTLTLDLDAVTINTSLAVGPGCIVGIRAKNLQFIDMTSPGFSEPLNVPSLTSATTALTDVNQNAADLTTEPAHQPDYETHSLQLGEFVAHWDSGTNLGADIITCWAHLRSVNARGSAPSVGDLLPEDYDSNRNWIPVGVFVTADQGTGGSPANTSWLCIGPGATL